MANRYGTLGADSLNGTSTDDYISGGPLGSEAADTGNDTLLGGTGGFDVVHGWGGADSIVGSNDNRDDNLSGGDGNDTISIRSGEADGGAGNDLIASSSTNGGYSGLYGGGGADTIFAGAGNDELYDDAYFSFNTDADSLSGGRGLDNFVSLGGADSMDGGANLDFATIDRSALTVGFRFTPADADTAYLASDGTMVVNIEGFYVRGGSGDDTLSTYNDLDQLYGGDGDDSITANGDILVSGGSSNDTLSLSNEAFASGGDGDDLITLSGDYFDTGSSGGDGNDTLVAAGTEASVSLAGGAGADSLIGGDGSDYLDDEGDLSGSDNAIDTLSGGLGDDTLISNNGADRIDGGGGFDLAVIYRSMLTTNFSLRLAAATTTATDGTTLTGIESVLVLSGSGRDELTAHSGDDALYGDAGNDSLNGGKGDDTLSGGEDADTLIGGAGADEIAGGAGADTFRWIALDRKNVDDVRDFEHGPDTLQFSAGALGGLLALGALDATNFALGAATAARPQFIFRTSTDTLLWDADGTGAGKAIAIATFNNAPAIDATDIVIIA